MDNHHINQSLILGELAKPGVLPHVDGLRSVDIIFQQDFGLSSLPLEPGVISVRGPRQYGKSTWLEQQIASTIREFGPGTALYLNGDEIVDHKILMNEMRILIQLFPTKAPVKRLFIDEITAVKYWENAVKRLIDTGELANILLVTTGSKAADLRRGIERLPGRKGKLDKTNYIFTPISYQEFFKQCHKHFKSDTLFAYILSGGSPIAANEIVTTGRIPEYVMTIISDWVLGEFARKGRSRSHLLAVLQSLYRMSGIPIGQAKLARESGLANNTEAQNYIELLSDLMAVIPIFPYDFERKITIFRKPCKYHFINLAVALCWHPKKPRTIDELKQLGPELGPVFEWVVAQELWRRWCVASADDLPDYMNFWQSKEHEIDFVLPHKKMFVEVKSGKTNPYNFTWFLKSFSQEELIVVSQREFSTERIRGVSLHDFLLGQEQI